MVDDYPLQTATQIQDVVEIATAAASLCAKSASTAEYVFLLAFALYPFSFFGIFENRDRRVVACLVSIYVTLR